MTRLASFPFLGSALDLLADAFDSVPPEALTRETPCDAWTVAQVLQHAAGDQLAWAAIVGDTPMPSFDPFAPSGELDPGLIGSALDNAVASWSAVSPTAASIPTPLPQGAMTAEDAALACAIDASVHSWDVAMGLGATSPLTDELAAGLMPVALAIVEPLRQWGAYAAPLIGGPDDGPADQLLRYLGRDPRWTA